MKGFNYNKFRSAVEQAKEEMHNDLVKEVNQITEFIEKALTMSFESKANIARMNYPGIDL